MTNNYEMADKEVVEFYNDRGESERLFDEMNNDFLWKKMPFYGCPGKMDKTGKAICAETVYLEEISPFVRVKYR